MPSRRKTLSPTSAPTFLSSQNLSTSSFDPLLLPDPPSPSGSPGSPNADNAENAP
ncbi:hypothetical protein TeGR_g9736, partial [Tetraparma gracilis]